MRGFWLDVLSGPTQAQYIQLRVCVNVRVSACVYAHFELCYGLRLGYISQCKLDKGHVAAVVKRTFNYQCAPLSRGLRPAPSSRLGMININTSNTSLGKAKLKRSWRGRVPVAFSSVPKRVLLQRGKKVEHSILYRLNTGTVNQAASQAKGEQKHITLRYKQKSNDRKRRSTQISTKQRQAQLKSLVYRSSLLEKGTLTPPLHTSISQTKKRKRMQSRKERWSVGARNEGSTGKQLITLRSRADVSRRGHYSKRNTNGTKQEDGSGDGQDSIDNQEEQSWLQTGFPCGNEKYEEQTIQENYRSTPTRKKKTKKTTMKRSTGCSGSLRGKKPTTQLIHNNVIVSLEGFRCSYQKNKHFSFRLSLTTETECCILLRCGRNEKKNNENE